MRDMLYRVGITAREWLSAVAPTLVFLALLSVIYGAGYDAGHRAGAAAMKTAIFGAIERIAAEGARR